MNDWAKREGVEKPRRPSSFLFLLFPLAVFPPSSPSPPPPRNGFKKRKQKQKQPHINIKQDLDVAIIKATSSATHVAPKEKHVAALKYAVGPQAPRAQVSYVCRELRARLRSAM